MTTGSMTMGTITVTITHPTRTPTTRWGPKACADIAKGDPVDGARSGQRLFEGYMAVDWSAASVPRQGADSIWIAASGWGGADLLENPATRAEAEARIRAILAEATAQGRRLLCGFDFPFGYPAGTARALTGEDDWRPLWARLAAEIEEGPGNANNRFDLAARLNAAFPGEGPFWGNGLRREIPGLPRRKPGGWGTALPANARAAERAVPRAQEVWKLAGIGSVGGQALTGIAALERLRRATGARIWPFEPLGTGHVFAEIYPSLLDPDPKGPVKDAGQVRAVVTALDRLDRAGRLAAHLEAPARMPPEVIREEAAILGMEDPAGFRRSYETDPARIYAESFRIIAAEADLSALPRAAHPMAVRLIHASGMTDIAADLRLSANAPAAGQAALAAGAPILCDTQMVAHGIIARALPGPRPCVTLADPSVPALAQTLGTTRSAAAVALWRDRIDGAVVAIGNAPTALFYLLQRLAEGWPRPALILAFPVGFVGAAESKAALIAEAPCPYVTLTGRRGGSAMAAAAVNALTLGLGGDGT
ncbi:MAG: precorrin-8X methylmutase [Pseudomonadota bacterium]